MYVIELDRAVLGLRRFRDANPDVRDDKPCVYVGQTALDPEVRFAQHRAGVRSSRIVRAFGVRLRPRKSRNYGSYPTRELAEAAERRLAERLRRRGYGVWTN